MSKRHYSTFLLSDYTAGSVSIKTSFMESGNCEMHFHDCIEFELITGGSGFQTLNGEKHDISKSAFSMLGPLDYHEVGAYSEGLETYTLMFRSHLLPERFMHFFAASGGFVFSLSPERYNLILSLFHSINNATGCCINDDIFYSRLIDCIMESVVQNMDTAGDIKKYDSKFQEIIAYVNLHFKENPTIGDISRLFHYNKNYVCNLFEKHLGITYVEYLTGLKVRYAQRMLESTDLSVSHICFECGFGSISGFGRAFKKIAGNTPTQIRSRQNSITN